MTVREMIFASSTKERKEFCLKFTISKNDFYELFKSLEGRPCNIRSFDPPLQ